MVLVATSRSRDRGDIVLYVLSAAFAALTAATSTLVPHRAWGQVAVIGYGAAAVVSLLLYRFVSRFWLAVGAWVLVALVPLTVQAVQRAGGRGDRAQEEVVVVEYAGARLLDTGSPYLGRPALATLPADERLLGYAPYQPGMALFGLPRAVLGSHWWTDARVWFAVATIAALAAVFHMKRRFTGLERAGLERAGLERAGLERAGLERARLDRLLRAGQAATVLPVCALTLATGGDDIPVLALSLLAFAYAARSKFFGTGLAIGAAGALKLFAWPVAAVLLVLAWHHGRRAALSYAVPALGLPALALLPALAVDADAVMENVVRFPSGRGIVTSPAQSPLPGHLIAAGLPGGHTIALGLLLLAGVVTAFWLLRRPPHDAADAALVTAVGLTAAIMLTPATRFGYLLYPVAYATAWWAIRSREPAVGRTQGG